MADLQTKVMDLLERRAMAGAGKKKPSDNVQFDDYKKIMSILGKNRRPKKPFDSLKPEDYQKIADILQARAKRTSTKTTKKKKTASKEDDLFGEGCCKCKTCGGVKVGRGIKAGKKKTKKAGAKKDPNNKWIDFVKYFSAEMGISYGDALKVAGPYYRGEKDIADF